MKTVNGTSIIEKIKDAHDRNQQFHRGRDKPDVCITDEDLDNLNLDHVDIDPLPQSCIDTCAPIGRKVPLAMACAGATCFAAIAILVCSLAAFCSFCCCNPTEPPTYVMVRVAIAPARIYPDRACLLLQATAFNKSCCLINHFTGTYVVAARSNRSRDLGLCCIRVLACSALLVKLESMASTLTALWIHCRLKMHPRHLTCPARNNQLALPATQTRSSSL